MSKQILFFSKKIGSAFMYEQRQHGKDLIFSYSQLCHRQRSALSCSIKRKHQFNFLFHFYSCNLTKYEYAVAELFFRHKYDSLSVYFQYFGLCFKESGFYENTYFRTKTAMNYHKHSVKTSCQNSFRIFISIFHGVRNCKTNFCWLWW